MSLLHRPFEAHLVAPPLRRAARRALASVLHSLRRRPAPLVVGEAPGWLLRDVGWLDGRDAAARRAADTP